jgi:hypothetical protein
MEHLKGGRRLTAVAAGRSLFADSRKPAHARSVCALSCAGRSAPVQGLPALLAVLPPQAGFAV